jgi:hypothetical protein
VGAAEVNGFPEMGLVEMEERDGEDGFSFQNSLRCQKKEKKEELK